MIIFLCTWCLIPAISAAGDGDILGRLEQKMGYLNERQQVISTNLANLHTPGYKARDLSPLKFKSTHGRLPRVQVLRTSPQHLEGNSQPRRYETVENEDPFDVTLDGNSVVLDEQMLLMNESRMNFNEASKILKKLKEIKGLSLSAQGG